MGYIVNVKTIPTEDLLYQQDLHERYISSLEGELERRLINNISGYANCNVKLSYDPRTNLFEVIEVDEQFRKNLFEVIEVFFKKNSC